MSLEEVAQGSTSGASAVATATSVTAADDHLYLAAVATRPYQPAISTSGLGLTWVLLASRCGGRGQTGVDVYAAQGTTSGSAAVTATLSAAADNAVLVVSRYADVASAGAVGNVVSGNSNGVSGACSGGTDGSSYTVDLDVTLPDAVAYGAVGLRTKTHTPGAGYTEQAEIAAGTGGAVAGLAVQDRTLASAGTVDVDGTLSGASDWAVVGVEILPADTDPEIDVAPTQADFGDVVQNGSTTRTFVVSNTGGGPLDVTAADLSGPDAGVFAIESGGAPFTLAPGASRDVVVRFSPVAAASADATLTLTSDDPDEASVALALTGAGIPPPPTDVTLEATVTGGASTAASVATAAPMAAAPDDLYLAAVSTKPYRTTTSVTGLGLAWTPVASQCGGRSQTGVDVFAAQGTPTAGIVSAQVASSADNLALVVSRYSGVDPGAPIGGVARANANGPAGACSGGADAASYAVDLTVATPGAVAHGAVAIRSSSHTPGSGYTEQAELFQGTGGSTAGVAVQNRPVLASGPAPVDGTLSSNTDWAVVGIELVPPTTATPVVDVAPGSHDYGEVDEGSTAGQTFVVGNTGLADLDVTATALSGSGADQFDIESGGAPFSLSPGATRDVVVEFAPDAIGTASASLDVASNDPLTPSRSVALVGQALPLPQPDISVDSTSHFFNSVYLGLDATHAFLVTNDGSAPLSVAATTVSGPDAVLFTIGQGAAPFSLDPGESRYVFVTFEPPGLGLFDATFILASDDPDEPQLEIPLVGEGIPFPTPDIVVSPQIFDYGEVPVGETRQVGILVKNIGSANLAVTSISAGGPDADLLAIEGATTFTLVPSFFRGVFLDFTPTAEGPASLTVTIASNDPDMPTVDVALTGEGIMTAFPEIAVTPTDVQFGGVDAGESASRTVAISNTGEGYLLLSDVSLQGAAAYSIASGGGSASVAPGEAHDVVIDFSPPVDGLRGGTLVIESNDPDEPQVLVPILGAGVGPASSADIALEQVETGAASGAAAVSTGAALDADDDHLYLAAVSTRPYAPVTDVSGLGVDWSLVASQCGGRGQTGVDLFAAHGLPGGGGVVTASLSASADASVLTVSRYSGVDPAAPLADVASANSNGASGGCSGGTDGASWAVDLEVEADGAVAYGAVALRARLHTPGNGFTEQAEVSQGTGGAVAGLAVEDRELGATGTTTVDGSLSGDADWAAIAVEIAPALTSAELSVDPTSFDYGDVIEGELASQTLRVFNTGNVMLVVDALVTGSGAGSFTPDASALPLLVPPGGQRNLALEFAPPAPGATVATLELDSNDLQLPSLAIPLAGNGLPVPTPDVAIDPASHDYGGIDLGDATSQTFEVRNDGTAALDVVATPIAGATAYSVASGGGPFSLAPGATRDLEVAFAPQGLGAAAADLTIESDDPDEPILVVSLAGTGLAPPAPEITVTPTSADLGDVFVGEPASQLFEVRNDGTADLIVSDASLAASPAFSFIGDTSGTLVPGASTNVEVTFVPVVAGPRLAYLNITSNDADEGLLAIQILAAGVEPPDPDIAVAPTDVDLGEVDLGTSDSTTITITNDGPGALDLEGIALSGDPEFAIESGGAPGTLAPGGFREVVVSVTPASEDDFAATLTIDSDDPDEPQVIVALAATGVVPLLPDIAVSPPAHDFGDVVVDSSAYATITVANTGNAALAVTGTALSGPDAAAFAVAEGAAPFDVPAGTSRDVLVRFDAATTGSAAAVLAIASDDPDQAQVDVSLAANGVPPPAGGDITLVELETGTSAASTTVTTSAPLSAGEDHLYLAAVATKPHDAVVGVSGLGLGWSAVDAQCAGRSQTGTSLWMAIGDGGADGAVTATLADTPSNAVIAVARYANVDPANPLGDVASANSNGADGGCSGGSDTTAYSVPLATGFPGAVVFGATATRNRTHAPGPGYTTLANVSGGSGGETAGLSIQDRSFETPTGTAVSGSLSLVTDWASIGAEIVPLPPQDLPDVGPLPANVDWGEVFLGQSATRIVTVANDGDADLVVMSTAITGAHAGDFSVVAGAAPFVVAPGGSHDVEVQLAPLATGIRSAVLHVASDDPDEGLIPIALSGTGTPPPTPDIGVAPTSHDFGAVEIGATGLVTIVVDNDGDADLDVTATPITGDGDFAIQSGGAPFVLAPGASRDVEIAVVPAAVGARSATLHVESDDPDESPLDVALSATGTAPIAPDIDVAPTSHDFGDVALDDTGVVTLTVTNTGTLDLEVSASTLGGANPGDFALASGAAPFTLSPAATRDVVVDFAPSALGARSATLTFTSDDPDEASVAVSLAGNGVATPVPDVAVTPPSHDFGDVVEGGSVAVAIRVSNEGTGDLHVSDTVLTGNAGGEFAIDDGAAPFELAPGEDRDVVVRFDAVIPGGAGATLEIDSDDPDEAQVDVPVSALVVTGQAPPTTSVTWEETRTGGSTDSDEATTAGSLTAVDGDLYVAAAASKPFSTIASVAGLGLAWTPLDTQCGGREQTGVDLWYAHGTPSGDGPVTVSMVNTAENVAIAVLHYSHVDAAQPVGNTASANSNGLDGACAGGTDGDAYEFDVTTTQPGARVVAAAAMRTVDHTSGPGYAERVEFVQGTGGGTTSIAVQDVLAPAAFAVPVRGKFSSPVDWGASAFEIRPSGSTTPVPDVVGETEAVDFGTALVGGAPADRSVDVGNDGNADLDVDTVAIEGTHAADFSIEAGFAPFTVAPAEAGVVDVRFTPSAAGTRDAFLRIESNDPNETPLDVPLTGLAVDVVEPDIDVVPTNHDFGSLAPGQIRTTWLAVRNLGLADVDVTLTKFTGSGSFHYEILAGGAPFTVAPGETHEIEIEFEPSLEGPLPATFEITSTDPATPQIDVAVAGVGAPIPDAASMWISPAEIAALPANGSAWDALLAAANGDLGAPNLADQDNTHDVLTLAVALVYARTGDPLQRQKTRDAILAAMGTEVGADAYIIGRNLFAYVVSAGLIDLATYDPIADATFRTWIDQLRTTAWPSGTVTSEDRDRVNNLGRMAGATRVAVAIYLGDRAEIEDAARVFRGALGDRDAYAGFYKWGGDFSWQEDESEPVGVNPLGATKNGFHIDGALPEEMRRGCAFQFPPCETNYPWEALQGMVAEAVLLQRAGYDVFDWEDRALLRAYQFLWDLSLQYPDDEWWAAGDDTWQIWLVNDRYGEHFPTDRASVGKLMGWTDWTHPRSD